MNCKVNVKVNNLNNRKLRVILIDVDPIKNDLLGEKSTNKTEELEFIFSLSESGEYNPELQIKIFDEENNLIKESEINSEISGWSRDKVTGMFEKTTIEISPISII